MMYFSMGMPYGTGFQHDTGYILSTNGLYPHGGSRFNRSYESFFILLSISGFIYKLFEFLER